MSKTTKVDPPADELEAQKWADELAATPGVATDRESQQLARQMAADQVIEGQPIDLPIAEARRAANWVQLKRYGPKMTELTMWIAGQAVDTADLNAVIMEQMAEKILAADDPDGILDPFGTVSGEDLYERPIMVYDVQYLISTAPGQDGYPWYVALTYTDRQDGPNRVAIVGGEKLVPQVAGLDIANAFPKLVRITTKTTSKGNTVLELQQPQGSAAVPF